MLDFKEFPLFNKVVFVGKMVHLRYPIRILRKQAKKRNATQLTINFEAWCGTTTDKLMFTAEIDYP